MSEFLEAKDMRCVGVVAVQRHEMRRSCHEPRATDCQICYKPRTWNDGDLLQAKGMRCIGVATSQGHEILRIWYKFGRDEDSITL